MSEESRLYRKLVDASTDGLWLLDEEGRTLVFNPRMAELLGSTPEQMAGLSAFDVHDEQGKVQFAAHLASARAGDPGHNDLESMYLRLDGTTIWLLCSWRPIHGEDGALIGFLHRYSDYTEQRGLLGALRYRERMLESAQSIAAVGSWDWDISSDAVYWSDQLFHIYGVTPEEFEPTYAGFLHFFHPKDRDLVQSAVGSIFDGAGEFEFRARVVRADGGLRWILGLGVAERDRSGAPVRVAGTVQDITDKVTADREVAEAAGRLALLRQVAEVANRSTGLVETLLRSAPAFAAVEGWEAVCAFLPDHDEGSLIPLSFTPKDVPGIEGDPHLAATCYRTGELVVLPAPGHEGTHSLLGIPIRDGTRVACVVEMIAAEVPPTIHSLDMIEQVASILGRVAERERAAGELAVARDQAMEASRLKSEFLATMSHEIRTPMNGVIGLTDLLLRTALDDKQRMLVEALHGAGSTLRGILNDVLDLSKIEAGKLELELDDFEVRSVVEQTVRLLQAPADEKGLDLRLTVAPEVPAYVRGDAMRWEQVLANLGSNAVKFTDVGSVAVAVDLAEQTPDGVVIEVSVQDTGPGIPPGDQQRLFDSFTQADPSTTRRHGGSGLGLAIVRQLVAVLGGELDLSSEAGRGTTFRFTARFGRAAETIRPRPTPWVGNVPVAPDAPRVLVVEDNQVNQMVAVGLLESDGYTTAVVEDGVEAVAALAGDHGFSAVLMDCRMPRMDGYTATQEIRRQEAPGRRVPIIAMTASALEGERERCLEAGMDDFLTKPVDSARLNRVLRQWIPGTEVAPATPPPPPDEETPAPPVAQCDIVDLTRVEMLHEMVKDGVSLFQRSSGNFIAHAQDHLTAIGAALEQADADELMATAHKLKGSALNLGLPRVGAAAFELEERGRESRVDGAQPAFAALVREMGLAVAALEHERALRA